MVIMGTASIFSFHTYHTESQWFQDLLATAATVTFDEKTSQSPGDPLPPQARVAGVWFFAFSESIQTVLVNLEQTQHEKKQPYITLVQAALANFSSQNFTSCPFGLPFSTTLSIGRTVLTINVWGTPQRKNWIMSHHITIPVEELFQMACFGILQFSLENTMSPGINKNSISDHEFM